MNRIIVLMNKENRNLYKTSISSSKLLGIEILSEFYKDKLDNFDEFMGKEVVFVDHIDKGKEKVALDA